MDDLEKSAILAAIKASSGNISKAARALGTSRRTLQRHMRVNGIPEGTRGRRRGSLRYGKRRRGYGAVALGAAVGVIGAVIYSRRGPVA